jgi:hypothetical protein
MKKLFITLAIFAAFFSSAHAQTDMPGDDAKRQEKIQALYVAYVTKELDLTSDEAQKFWPVHNQFENELKAVKKDLPELEIEQARLNIKKKYQSSFNGILGVSRCERFFKMNQAFKKKLMERLRKQRQNRQQPMRRGQ